MNTKLFNNEVQPENQIEHACDMLQSGAIYAATKALLSKIIDDDYGKYYTTTRIIMCLKNTYKLTNDDIIKILKYL